MGSESPSFSITAWLALQVPYQYAIRAELDGLCGEHHLTFAYMGPQFSRLL